MGKEFNYPDGRPYRARPGEDDLAKEKKPPKYRNQKTLYLGFVEETSFLQ